MATINKKTTERVRKLYYDEKLSVQGVADKLNVSIDAVFYCMRKNSMKRRLTKESNAINFEKCEPSFNLVQLSTEKLRTLKIIGTMLYWGEGYKTGKGATIDFANSDKDMIILFLKFLRNICGVDEKRLRVYPYLYANQDIEKCVDFWSRITKIDRTRFTGPYIRKDYDEKKTDRMPYGLVHIRYSDKKLLDLIKKWISEYRSI
jgi:predicted DNA-binding protein YlxM (UPF0122 family)